MEQILRLLAADEQRVQSAHEQRPVDRCVDDVVDEVGWFALVEIRQRNVGIAVGSADEDDGTEDGIASVDALLKGSVILGKRVVVDEIEIGLADRLRRADLVVILEEFPERGAVTRFLDE